MIWFVIALILGHQHINRGIEIENAFVRPARMGMTAAMYFQVINRTDKPDTLYAAYADVFELAQIHESYMKNGMMGMRRVKFVVVPPKSTFEFKPGGYHIMLINARKNLVKGDKVNVELWFKRAGKLDINAKVQD